MGLGAGRCGKGVELSEERGRQARARYSIGWQAAGARGGACSGPRGTAEGPQWTAVGRGAGGHGGPRWDAGGRGGPQWTKELFCVYFASSAPVPFPVGAVCLNLVFREQTLNW